MALALMLAFCALPALSGPADAQSCRQINAELRSLSSSGNSAQAARYERAIRQQRMERDKAVALSQADGCRGLFSGLRQQCGAARSAIRRMDSNLASLTAARDRVRGRGSESRRSQLVAALAANGCNAATPPRAREANVAPQEQRRDTLFDRLTSAQLRQQTAMSEDRSWPSGAVKANSGARGNLRTICVRTCDGYFFPIAYQTARANFDRDAAACAAMCPGTNVELHYHHVPDQESGAMMSAATDRPYADAEFAYRYRQAGYQRPDSCSCTASKNFSIVAGGGGGWSEFGKPAAAAAEPEAESAATDRDAVTATINVPLPESVADDAVDAAAPDSAPVDAADETPRRVRVVGPTFLPDL